MTHNNERPPSVLTTSSMVERVARAIHAVEFEPGDSEAAATMECPALREFRLAQARAAIEAPLEEAARIVERAAIDDDMAASIVRAIRALKP